MVTDEARLATSVICYAEVLLGFVRAGQDDRQVRQLFDRISVLPFDRAAAESYVRMPFRRRSFDCLIGAHALAIGAVLITANIGDFADVTGLQVENWLS